MTVRELGMRASINIRSQYFMRRVFERLLPLSMQMLVATSGLYLLLKYFNSRVPLEVFFENPQNRQFLFLIGAAVLSLIFIQGLAPLLKDAGFEASLSTRRSEARDIAKIRRELELLQKNKNNEVVLQQLKDTAESLKSKLEEDVSQSEDLSEPDKIFGAARRRLTSDSLRIDKISRRNLYFGIVFSACALGVLAFPILEQSLSQHAEQAIDVARWISQTYLPRFAIGLLLQFVGFFFLRLYVANEVDLKHNKNELTNLESKMIAFQYARTLKDASAHRQIIKCLSETERNFVLKKGEKLATADAHADYNDVKSIIEKLISKIPGKG